MNLLILLSLLFASDGVIQDSKKELTKFQGMWKASSLEINGQTQTGDRVEAYPFAVVDDTFSFHTEVGTLKLNPSKSEVDLLIAEGLHKGKTRKCLYQIKGDELRIAYDPSGNRPKGLETDGHTSHQLYVFQRDSTYSKAETIEYVEERKEVAAESVRGMVRNAAVQEQQKKLLERLKQLQDKYERLQKESEALEKSSNGKK